MGEAKGVRTRADFAAFAEGLTTEVSGLTAAELLSRMAVATRHVPWVSSFATAMLANGGGWRVAADIVERAVRQEPPAASS